MKSLLLAAMTALALMGTARADVVPQDSVVEVRSGSQILNSYGALGGNGSSASATSSLTFMATGDTIAGNLPGQFFGEFGKSTATFFYAINGPSSLQIPVEVPLILIANLTTSVTGGPFDTANSDIEGSFGAFQACSSLLVTTCFGNPAAIAIDKSFEVNSGIQQDITILTDSNGGQDASNGLSTGFAEASGVCLEIDPTFLAANPGFSLAVSSDVTLQCVSSSTPPTPVPEPGSLAFLLTGLGLIGLTARRHPKF